MGAWYTINTVTILARGSGAKVLFPGTQLDDATDLFARAVSAGADLRQPTPNIVTASARVAQRRITRAIDEREAESIMRSAVDADAALQRYLATAPSWIGQFVQNGFVHVDFALGDDSSNDGLTWNPAGGTALKHVDEIWRRVGREPELFQLQNLNIQLHGLYPEPIRLGARLGLQSNLFLLGGRTKTASGAATVTPSANTTLGGEATLLFDPGAVDASGNPISDWTPYIGQEVEFGGSVVGTNGNKVSGTIAGAPAPHTARLNVPGYYDQVAFGAYAKAEWTGGWPPNVPYVVYAQSRVQAPVSIERTDAIEYFAPKFSSVTSGGIVGLRDLEIDTLVVNSVGFTCMAIDSNVHTAAVAAPQFVLAGCHVDTGLSLNAILCTLQSTSLVGAEISSNDSTLFIDDDPIFDGVFWVSSSPARSGRVHVHDRLTCLNTSYAIDATVVDWFVFSPVHGTVSSAVGYLAPHAMIQYTGAASPFFVQDGHGQRFLAGPPTAPATSCTTHDPATDQIGPSVPLTLANILGTGAGKFNGVVRTPDGAALVRTDAPPTDATLMPAGPGLGPTTTITADATLTNAQQNVEIDTRGGPVTATFPPHPIDGQLHNLSNVDESWGTNPAHVRGNTLGGGADTNQSVQDPNTNGIVAPGVSVNLLGSGNDVTYKWVARVNTWKIY